MNAKEILLKHREKDNSLHHWITNKHAIEAMTEFSEHQNKELSEENEKLKKSEQFFKQMLIDNHMIQIT